MALRIGKIWWLAGAGAALGVLLAYAWTDGGQRPVRTIAEPVILPEIGQ